MANNYTQFSFVIDANEAERQWFEALPDYDDERWDFEEWKSVAENGPPCTIEIEAGEVWLYSDESGDPDGTANLVQKFLRENERTDAISFEVAFTCSKPRPDEFGGAAWYITFTEVRSFGTSTWLAQQEAT